MTKYDNLINYLDEDAYKIYNEVFFKNDELNTLIVKDYLKQIISTAKIKTLKDLLITRINVFLFKLNSMINENNYEIDNSIDHMNYMLKRQYMNLTKLSILINKTDDIDMLRKIYLNSNAMISICESSIIYFNNLLKMMEYEAKGITYLPNYKVDISINESKMNTITSNIKKLKK